MEKTKMMKRYEAETGKQALTYIMVYVSVDGYDHGELVPSEEYNNWLEAKATAYDRLMSGGKKTLKELANFLQRPIAIQPSRSGCVAVFANVPFLGETKWRGYWMSTIDCDFDFSGDWQDSLTLPDSWETKQE